MDASALLGLLARSLAGIDPDMAMPSRLCRACVEILGAQSGALTVRATPEDRVTVSSSDGMSAEIEDLEELLGEGPGQLALDEDRIVVTELDGDSPTDRSFPVFSHLVASITGPATAYAVPMHAGGRVIGVLSLYVTTSRLARDADDVQFLADAVGTALLGEIESIDWSARSRIHQATGMVTAQLHISPRDALAVLRAHAFAGSATLEDVAQDVLARRIGFTDHETDAITIERTEEP
ncbi:GAF and ANTAR domain-containing protein [Cellulosimicrobium sp. Marseille-Q4280]|uniref:GAF and ANTAR domain-containing protein n=1 Tax=Cellulosimicrobium sp. Marseille-Q4280 TaxID=2937992 RepID=UPI0020426B06|nr:GAF and ANTAR domain-containing protein [Cellulosimicrobium sp. Marseille-Q4280]